MAARSKCPGCSGSEDYDEGGADVPRIFPCGHTLCEQRIRELMKDDSTIVCPRCNKKHRVENKDVTEIKDKETEIFRREVTESLKNNEAKVEVILKAEEDAGDKMGLFVKEKKNITLCFEKKIEEAENQNKKTKELTEKCVPELRKDIKGLRSILQDLEHPAKVSPEQLANLRETFQAIKEKQQQLFW